MSEFERSDTGTELEDFDFPFFTSSEITPRLSPPSCPELASVCCQSEAQLPVQLPAASLKLAAAASQLTLLVCSCQFAAASFQLPAASPQVAVASLKLAAANLKLPAASV